MSTRLNEMLFQIPRSRQFFDNILADLVKGRSVLVLTPAGLDSDSMWEALRSELWRREFLIREVSLPQVPLDQSPVSALSNFLDVRWPASEMPHTVLNLLSLENLPHIIKMQGFQDLPESERMLWAGFWSQWAQASHSLADQGKSLRSLCMFVSASQMLPYLPLSDISLAVYWWWGIPSALELRLLCRLEEDQKKTDAKGKWREHLLPSLAGNDVILANRLWDFICLDIKTLIQQLRNFAEECGWTETALREWGACDLKKLIMDYSMQDPVSYGPPERLRGLWAQGALIWTQEYGIELHTSALVIMGELDVLNHRLWRGQASLLLPEIDTIRLNICVDFTQTYGNDWPLWLPTDSSEEDKALRSNPLVCQLGHLELLLKNCNRLRRSERRWVNMVSNLRSLRNQLAHYRPIEFSDFQRIYQEIDSLAYRLS